MKFEMEVYKDVDFLSRLLTSNPYTAEGKSILNGLKINLTMADFFEQKIYIFILPTVNFVIYSELIAHNILSVTFFITLRFVIFLKSQIFHLISKSY